MRTDAHALRQTFPNTALPLAGGVLINQDSPGLTGGDSGNIASGNIAASSSIVQCIWYQHHHVICTGINSLCLGAVSLRLHSA